MFRARGERENIYLMFFIFKKKQNKKRITADGGVVVWRRNKERGRPAVVREKFREEWPLSSSLSKRFRREFRNEIP